jgi:hypothetical protein
LNNLEILIDFETFKLSSKFVKDNVTYSFIESKRDKFWLFRVKINRTFKRNATGEVVETNLDFSGDLPLLKPNIELNVPDIFIVKHHLTSAKDILRIAKMDENGLFIANLFLTNIYVCLDYMRRRKLGVFITKFNDIVRQTLQNKFQNRADFSNYNCIDNDRPSIFREALQNVPHFWNMMIKNFENSVFELSDDDLELQQR